MPRSSPASPSLTDFHLKRRVTYSLGHRTCSFWTGDTKLVIALAVLFLAAGLAVSTRSGIVEAQAAGDRQISLWKYNPGYRRPRVSVLLQVAAVLLVGVGVIFFLVAWGPAAILLLVLTQFPPFIVISIHNKSLRKT